MLAMLVFFLICLGVSTLEGFSHNLLPKFSQKHSLFLRISGIVSRALILFIPNSEPFMPELWLAILLKISLAGAIGFDILVLIFH